MIIGTGIIGEEVAVQAEIDMNVADIGEGIEIIVAEALAVAPVPIIGDPGVEAGMMTRGVAGADLMKGIGYFVVYLLKLFIS